MYNLSLIHIWKVHKMDRDGFPEVGNLTWTQYLYSYSITVIWVITVKNIKTTFLIHSLFKSYFRRNFSSADIQLSVSLKKLIKSMPWHLFKFTYKSIKHIITTVITDSERENEEGIWERMSEKIKRERKEKNGR